MSKKYGLHFLNPSDHTNYFYEKPLQDFARALYSSLPEKAFLGVYPEAVFKRNGIPNGVAIVSPYEETLLFPHLLRDPGCGYLLFSLKFKNDPEENWQQKAGQAIDQLLIRDIPQRNTQKPFIRDKDHLQAILTRGLEIFAFSPALKQRFQDICFSVEDHFLSIGDEEFTALQNDFMVLTNTVELKKIQPINTEQLALQQLNTEQFVGFVHSGSHQFPGILGKRFLPLIHYYLEKIQKLTISPQQRGMIGIPLSSEVGQIYYEWLKAAMNYALVSRYMIYFEIKILLESLFDCEVSVINDSIHAGIFEEKDKNNKITKSVRGVQSLYSPQHKERSLRILAGERETISYLIQGKEAANQYHHLFSHGIGYAKEHEAHYQAFFSVTEQENYHTLAQGIYCNTKLNTSTLLNYTYNLNIAVNYFKELDILELIAILEPLINIQSLFLQQHNNGEQL